MHSGRSRCEHAVGSSRRLRTWLDAVFGARVVDNSAGATRFAVDVEVASRRRGGGRPVDSASSPGLGRRSRALSHLLGDSRVGVSTILAFAESVADSTAGSEATVCRCGLGLATVEAFIMSGMGLFLMGVGSST